jgi:hypothetical protein
MLPLLLVVVSLLFIGLVFSQVGSAGDQAVQAVTAADAAAVAGAHAVRDAGVSRTVHESLPVEFPFGAGFVAGVRVLPVPDLPGVACAAAVDNWTGNPHRSALGCGDLAVSGVGGEVTVRLTGPAGEVAGGPADVASARPAATATARVVLTRCPAPPGATPQGRAVAHWIAQTTADALDSPLPGPCLTPTDREVLEQLALLPEAAQLAAVGPAPPLLDSVTRAFHTEIIH